MDIEEAKEILTELGLELKEREIMRDILKDNYPEFLEEYIEFSSKADEAIKVVLEQLDWVTQQNEDWQLICEMQDQREYRSKFLKEFQEEYGENVFPDYDEIYKRYDTQKKMIDAMAKDMFCYLDNTISNYKKVNSVEELKQYYEKKVSEE